MDSEKGEFEFSCNNIRKGVTALMRSRSASHSVIFFCCVVMLFAGVSFGQDTDAKKDAPGGQTSASFASYCAGCHGSDGRGGERAPNIATDREMVKLSDARLDEILNKGVLASGMPGFSFLGEEKIKALVQHLRVLQGVAGSGQTQLPGDPQAGEQIFFGAASCSSCHMIDGRGGFLGEDLTAYAQGRSADAVRSAIVHPEDSQGDANYPVEVEIVRDKTYRGLIRARDNFNLVLQSEDGAFHSIAREDIKHIETSSHPLMPQDYATKLDNKQMDDLVSYLLKNSGTGKQAPAKGRDED